MTKKCKDCDYYVDACGYMGYNTEGWCCYDENQDGRNANDPACIFYRKGEDKWANRMGVWKGVESIRSVQDKEKDN